MEGNFLLNRWYYFDTYIGISFWYRTYTSPSVHSTNCLFERQYLESRNILGDHTEIFQQQQQFQINFFAELVQR